jgi:hypothetical protein
MDDQEAARRAAVDARAAKLKAAFEKAGGVAMEVRPWNPGDPA